MVSFENFSFTDGSPIYVQLILYIKRDIVGGVIKDGDEMPSRRMLSALLGVNPNTVQKVYKILEEEGLIVSTPGAKSIVTVDDKSIMRIKSSLMESELCNLVDSMKQMGFSKEDVIRLLDDVWEE